MLTTMVLYVETDVCPTTIETIVRNWDTTENVKNAHV